MDDLMAKLQDLLSSEEGRETIGGIAKSLTAEKPAPPASPIAESGGMDISSMIAALSSLLSSPQNEPPPPEAPITPEIVPSSDAENSLAGLSSLLGGTGGGLPLGAMAKLMSQSGGNNRHRALLLSLRPYFKDERQSKVDEALQFLQLFALLPLVKDSGLFKKGGLLG